MIRIKHGNLTHSTTEDPDQKWTGQPKMVIQLKLAE